MVDDLGRILYARQQRLPRRLGADRGEVDRPRPPIDRVCHWIVEANRVVGDAEHVEAVAAVWSVASPDRTEGSVGRRSGDE